MAADQFDSYRITETDSSARLLDLSHQQFYNLVDQDVRNRLNEHVARKRRDPAVVDRWYLVLVQMKKNVEYQLASARADWQTLLFTILAEIEDAETDAVIEGKRVEQFEQHPKYSEARAKKLRFRSAAEDSLSEARHLRNQQVEQRASTQLAFMTVRVHELGSAIEHHRPSCQTGDGNVLRSTGNCGAVQHRGGADHHQAVVADADHRGVVDAEVPPHPGWDGDPAPGVEGNPLTPVRGQDPRRGQQAAS